MLSDDPKLPEPALPDGVDEDDRDSFGGIGEACAEFNSLDSARLLR
jgi:hypothetical protein